MPQDAHQQKRCQRANRTHREAAQQKRLPDADQATDQPVEAQFEMKSLLLAPQHFDTKQVTEIIQGTHREWVADPDHGYRYQDVSPDPDRAGRCDNHLKRDRYKSTKYTQRYR